jgi:hypothetical protein
MHCAIMDMAARDRIESAEELLTAAERRFEASAVREAARNLMTALDTGDTWWVGFAERCLRRCTDDVRGRGKQLADFVAAHIAKEP